MINFVGKFGKVHLLLKEYIKILKERENNIQTKKELEAINKGKKFIKTK